MAIVFCATIVLRRTGFASSSPIVRFSSSPARDLAPIVIVTTISAIGVTNPKLSSW